MLKTGIIDTNIVSHQIFCRKYEGPFHWGEEEKCFSSDYILNAVLIVKRLIQISYYRNFEDLISHKGVTRGRPGGSASLSIIIRLPVKFTLLDNICPLEQYSEFVQSKNSICQTFLPPHPLQTVHFQIFCFI